MAKLLRADFARLFSYKRFLLLLGLTAALAAYLNYGYMITVKESGDYSIFPFELLIYCSFIITTFIAFFAGINFTDGVVRNKLFSGYSKAQIYLSNAVVSAFMVSVFTALYMLSGVWTVINNIMNLQTFLAYIFVSVIASIAFSSVGTFAAFVFRGKAVPIVVSAVLIVGMLLTTGKIQEMLSHTEYTQIIDTVNGVPYEDVSVIKDTDELTFKEVKDPNYISDKNIRKILETVYRLIPTSENETVASMVYSPEFSKCLLQRRDFYENADVTSPKDAFNAGNIAYSLAFIAVFTCAGVFIFRKEDLK